MIKISQNEAGEPRVVCTCDHCGCRILDARTAIVVWSPIDGWYDPHNPLTKLKEERVEKAGQAGMTGKKVFIGWHPYQVHEGYCDTQLRKVLRDDAGDNWVPLLNFLGGLVRSVTLEKVAGAEPPVALVSGQMPPEGKEMRS